MVFVVVPLSTDAGGLMLTGIVGKVKACAGIGCVGKEEAGKERVVLFAIDDIEEDAAAEFDAVLPVAICCI